MTSIEATGEGAPNSQDAAPPVVVVVVTYNPGPWFSETLQALADQDYPNLSVLIIDAGSAEDPLEQIVEILPTAYVRRLSRNPGYSAAANRVLRILRGASHLLVCHDDVAPAPDAVRKMVEEAFRTNAGIVTPKMVEWLRPDHLSALGGFVDTTGAYIPAVEAGDLDQGQHDTPQEVFVAPGGAMLVRSDLFTSLGGFDPAMTLQGEDVDFSWRAHVAGARVVTAPSARVRHLGAVSHDLRMFGPSVDAEHDGDEAQPSQVDELVLRRRHRLRTVLKTQRGFRLLVTIVQLLVLSVGEIVWGLLSGRSEHASAVIASWTWNIAHWRDLLKLRRQLNKFRAVDDKTIHAELHSTRQRIQELLLLEWETRSQRLRTEKTGRELVGSLRNLPTAVWATVLVIWLLGSRHLLSGEFPSVGQITPLLDSPYELLRQFSGTMPSDGWGAASTQSPLYLALALLGTLFFGAMGVLQRVLILGMLPLGVWGAWRVARPLKSGRAKLMAVIAYAAVPLPYDSLATGRWDGLVAYAAAPFILYRLLRIAGFTPYVDQIRRLARRSQPRRILDEDEVAVLVLSDQTDIEIDTSVARLQEASAMLAERTTTTTTESNLTETFSGPQHAWYLFVRRVAPLGLIVATAGLVAPQVPLATFVVAVALGLGTFLTRLAYRQALRVIGVAFTAGVLATILLLPGILSADSGWTMLWQAPPSSAAPDGFGALLRTYVGGVAPAVVSFGLLLAALPGILVGRSWRFSLSMRLWSVTLATVIVTWAGAHDWLGAIHPDPHVFLAFGGAALAINAAVGAVAVQEDLRGVTFGWRQAMPFVAVAGVVLAILPIGSRAGSGSWDLPAISDSQLLSWMADQPDNASFRVLWLGEGDAMPGGAREIAPDLAGAISVDGAIPRSPAIPSDGGKGQELLSSSVQLARRGDTIQLGALLAPYSVRYIVVPTHIGASSENSRALAVPADLPVALANQLDLRKVDTDDSVTVYENVAYASIRAALTPEQTLAAHSAAPNAALVTDLSKTVPILPNQSNGTWSGRLAAGDIYVAEDGSDAWQLQANGHQMKRETGFDWANTFSIGATGNAKLKFVAPLHIPLLQALDVIAWFLVLLIVVRYRVKQGRWT